MTSSQMQNKKLLKYMRNQLNHTASMATTSVEASTAAGYVAEARKGAGDGGNGHG